MKSARHSQVLTALAAAYEHSAAGRTGQAGRDFQIDYRELLRRAQANDGEARVRADADLQAAAAAGWLALDKHPHDCSLTYKVRLPLAHEAALYEYLGALSPAQKRKRMADQLAQAAETPVPEAWQTRWRQWCEVTRQGALTGKSIAPLSIQDFEGNQELLALMPQLLAWRGESLLRFASCVLCGTSKRLEELSGKLESLLTQINGGQALKLEDLGLLANPRFVLCHGPLQLATSTGALDLGFLSGPFRLSMDDISRATLLSSRATRCVTIENETTFHELAKGHSGDLLIQTSYPGSGTLALLERLPRSLAFWHFGDSDPDGFEILRDLRERSGLPFRSLHMRFRAAPRGPDLTPEERRKLERLIASPTMAAERPELEAMLAAGHKGAFEQESLGRPRQAQWPYY